MTTEFETEYEREGGCAFPFTANGIGGETNEADPGMTLRDWFAGQALAGILTTAAGPCMTGMQGAEKVTAQTTYSIADAMIAAGKESQDD